MLNNRFSTNLSLLTGVLSQVKISSPIGLVFVLMLMAIPVRAQVVDSAFKVMLYGLYNHSVPTIDPDEVGSLSNYQILDAREKNEYEISHLPNAVPVGYERFSKKAVKELDPDKPVLIYCTVGYRSEKIGEKLMEMGFKDVHNLYGGIVNWKNKGNQVVNKYGGPTEEVHCYSKEWSIWLMEGQKVYD